MTLLQARMMKVVLSGVLFLFGALFLVPCSFADAVFGPIHVNNPSFETEPAGGLPESCGANCQFSSHVGIPGWKVASGSSPFTGQVHPSISGPGHIFNSFAPNDGEISAYSQHGTIFQQVGQTVQLGVPYVFTVELGHRNDLNFEASADLLLSSNHNSPVTIPATGTVPTRGNWSTFTADFVGNSMTMGDHITIQLNSGGGQGNFDSVTLTAVPEPGTLLLFGTGLLLLGTIGRKLLHA